MGCMVESHNVPRCTCEIGTLLDAAEASIALRTESERLKAAINYFDRNSHEDNWPQQAERLKEELEKGDFIANEALAALEPKARGAK